MDPTETLGYKQNNPLNMRPLSNQLWHGQTGAANGFCVFSDAKFCFRAWLIEARNYKKTWGCECVIDYIKHYAPPDDGNDPTAYTATVEKFMGLTPNQWFDLEARALDFCKGQMTVEIGGVPYTDEAIQEGLALP